MADINIDFGNQPSSPAELAEQNGVKPNEETTPLNGGGTPDITGTKAEENKPNEGNVEETKQDNSSTGELEVGQQIEFDGNTYTVAKNGDIVDANGAVFKAAAEVSNWLATVQADEDKTDNKEDKADGSISIDALRDAFGIDVTDEDGNDIEFPNTADGVKDYVDNVIAIKTGDIQDAAINTFFMENPMVADFINYCRVNGGSPAGYGTMPDRSQIILDKDNINQQEYIIRMAAEEFGNKSLNDTYIKYLKDSGALYDEAKAQLDLLIKKDNDVRNQMAADAEAARQAEDAKLNAFWGKVGEIITSRKLGDYTIPESIIRDVNGQKITLTTNDFMDYVSRHVTQTEDGEYLTAYQADCLNVSEDERINKQLIDAWLMFSGGTYKDLLDMAVREDKVRTLRLKSKEQRATKPLRLVSKQNAKVDSSDIVLM